MPKTIAELRQELQDAGRDVRMAGEMVERATGGSQDYMFIREWQAALAEANDRVLTGILALDTARTTEAAK